MTFVIHQEDFISSVAEKRCSTSATITRRTTSARSPQAYEREQSCRPRAMPWRKFSINSRMCYEGHRPRSAGPAGIVNAFVHSIRHGFVRFEACPRRGATRPSPDRRISRTRAYLVPTTNCAGSLQADPARRQAHQHQRQHSGSCLCRSRRGGTRPKSPSPPRAEQTEAKSKFVMLNPNDSVVDWVLRDGAHNRRA